MRIALIGPDGSGKSSVCEALIKDLNAAKVIYAGKRDFRYSATNWGYNAWLNASKTSVIFGVLVQYLVYYPLEYHENYRKFTRPYFDSKILIYDRHPIDRIIMKYEFYAKFKIGKIKLGHLMFEYPFRAIWGFIYDRFFPSIDMIFLLAPEADTIFERSSGQYNDIAEAETRVMAYKLVLGKGKFLSLATILDVTKEDTVDEICKTIKSTIVDLDNNIT